MEKGYNSSGDSTNNSGSSSNTDQYLKHLNKISHKISKPVRRNPFDHQNLQHQQQQNLPPPPQQHQPPVYNINKSDFRDVVQKLTGSPAHDRFSTPPPIHPPKPQSSRLQRIRPPPLAHVSNKPPPPLHNPTANSFVNSNNFNNFTINNGRPMAPLSPLPPFPAVHAAAESPISAYMRYLQSSATADPESRRFSGLSPLAPLLSPKWSNPNSLQYHQQAHLPSPGSALGSSHFLMPSSPLSFGHLPSPRSPYPLLSPSLMFSPSAGQLGFPQFPLSPSPRWRDL